MLLADDESTVPQQTKGRRSVLASDQTTCEHQISGALQAVRGGDVSRLLIPVTVAGLETQPVSVLHSCNGASSMCALPRHISRSATVPARCQQHPKPWSLSEVSTRLIGLWPTLQPISTHLRLSSSPLHLFLHLYGGCDLVLVLYELVLCCWSSRDGVLSTHVRCGT